MPFETSKEGYVISTDKTRLDRQEIHRYLSERSYWAQGRSRETLERCIDNSLCFGVYQGERQAGFSRIITDFATFAWLCDVFILEEQRGRGLGKWMIETIVHYPELQGIKIFLLGTKDAHGLYQNYGGFMPLAEPEKWMLRSLI